MNTLNMKYLIIYYELYVVLVVIIILSHHNKVIIINHHIYASSQSSWMRHRLRRRAAGKMSLVKHGLLYGSTQPGHLTEGYGDVAHGLAPPVLYRLGVYVHLFHFIYRLPGCWS